MEMQRRLRLKNQLILQKILFDILISCKIVARGKMTTKKLIPCGFDRLKLEVRRWLWSKLLEHAKQNVREFSYRLRLVREELGEFEAEKVEEDLARLSVVWKAMSHQWDGQPRPYMN
jgi:hypothetical protein